MNIKSAAQVIRDSVTMDQILDIYGYHARHGFMVCPFHADKGPSLKVYKGSRGWHCYGCHRGGSVIDFVMEQEGCDFGTAVNAINHAFRLGLNDPQEDPYDAEDRRHVQEWLDQFTDAVYAYLDALRMKIEAEIRTDLVMVQELEMIRKMDPQKLKAEDYDVMLLWRDKSEYNEFKLEQIEEFRGEVAAWRRKARKAGSVSSRKK